MKDVNLLIKNGVNVSGSLELFGDMEMYDATLNDFLAGVDEKLNKIRTFKETGDMTNYAIEVHSLKSDAKYLGFTKLAEIAYEHELQSKASNMYFICEKYDELLYEANRIINLVKTYLGLQSNSDSFVSINNEPKENMSVIEKDKAILVVDDSDIVRNYIKKIFNNDFDVIVANDGGRAIEIVNSELKDKIVGMLLDLNMPNVNGFEVLEYFKQNNLFMKIPVSIITGEDSKEKIEEAFKYQIVDVIVKPFNEVNIKSVVEKTINYNK